MAPPLVVYVDVDDTLIRTFSGKRIAVTRVVEHVRALHAQGAELYGWSTGGAAYVREVATELGIEGCFVAFLPKPGVMIDDLPPGAWRGTMVVHPNGVVGETVETYGRRLRGEDGREGSTRGPST